MKYAIAAALIISGLAYVLLAPIPAYGFVPIFIGLGVLLWGAEWTDF